MSQHLWRGQARAEAGALCHGNPCASLLPTLYLLASWLLVLALEPPSPPSPHRLSCFSESWPLSEGRPNPCWAHPLSPPRRINSWEISLFADFLLLPTLPVPGGPHIHPPLPSALPEPPNPKNLRPLPTQAPIPPVLPMEGFPIYHIPKPGRS